MKKFYFLYLFILPLFVFAQTPKLASRPSATSVVYLDFDGHFVANTSWNDTTDFIDAQPSNISKKDITSIYKIVKEDFVTLNLNITTDSLYYEQASIYSRHRVIITPTSSWYVNGTGAAIIGGFAFGDESPSFVFCDRLNNNYYQVSQVISHEIGHALGLQHISEWNEDCTLKNEYKGIQGHHYPTFSPIMGNSFESDITGWVNDLSVLGCNVNQNEIEGFQSGRFGFIQLPDDISDNFAHAKSFSPYSAHVTEGIISDSNDVDIFKLTLHQPRIIDIDVTPNRLNKQTTIGINFIPIVELYNADSVLIRTYHDPYGIDVFIDTVLNAGTYYFKVRSTGGENLPYYSSFGSYEFLYLVRDVALSDLNIDIKGKQIGDKHELSWSYNTLDGNIAYLQYSLDGVNFSSLYKDSLAAEMYSWVPRKSGMYFYRVNIVGIDGNSKGYSNILRINLKNDLYRLMYNLIRDKVEILMFEPGEYELINMQGRSIKRGKLVEGYQRISVENEAKGVLLLRIVQKGNNNIEKLIVL